MKKLLIIFFLLSGLCYAQIPQINENKLNDYKVDMNNLLDKILFKRIAFDGETYPESIDRLYKMGKIAHKKLLQNKDNIQEKQNLLYSYGVISAFPEDICDEFHNAINKYNVNYYDDFISQNLNCQFYYALRFLEPYKIKNTGKYVKFIKKIDLYQQKIYEMQKELDLF